MADSEQISAKELQTRLDLEMALRSPPSAISFFLAGLLYAFFSPAGLPVWLFPVLGSMIMIGNVIRFRAAKSAMKLNALTADSRFKMYLGIVINTVTWSVLFSFASIAIGYKDWHITGPLLTLYGFIAASPFTLSYSKRIFIFFILTWTVPQVSILLYKNWEDPIPTQFLTIYGANIFFVLAYSVRQGFSYRKQVIEGIVSEIVLRKTNEELIASKEKVLEQTAMAQHANRLSALGEMAAGIAHEINNPLAIILGNIQYLEKTLSLVSAEDKILLKQKESIKKTQDSIGRIAKIIKGLRILTRPSDREDFEKYNLGEIIRDTISFCEEKFKISGVQFVTEGDLDLQIDCRPVQISQIVINLFNNAYDAMEEANLDPRFIRLTCHVEQDHVFLTVSNPGRQIEARIQEKLFQPFFTTKEVGKGTGLGLSISKSMAKQHNGDLNYKWDSQRNENQFVLQIPLLPK